MTREEVKAADAAVVDLKERLEEDPNLEEHDPEVEKQSIINLSRKGALSDMIQKRFVELYGGPAPFLDRQRQLLTEASTRNLTADETVEYQLITLIALRIRKLMAGVSQEASANAAKALDDVVAAVPKTVATPNAVPTSEQKHLTDPAFTAAVEELMRPGGLEGGYVNNPADPGGETKWGISKRSNPEVDIRNMTVEQAKLIYWKKYWQPAQIGALIDRVLQFEMLEVAANCGVPNAVRILQRAITISSDQKISTGRTPGGIDGIMGPMTTGAANDLSSKKDPAFLKAFNGFQFMYYAELVTKDPARYKRFFHSWMRRIPYNPE